MHKKYWFVLIVLKAKLNAKFSLGQHLPHCKSGAVEMLRAKVTTPEKLSLCKINVLGRTELFPFKGSVCLIYKSLTIPSLQTKCVFLSSILWYYVINDKHLVSLACNLLTKLLTIQSLNKKLLKWNTHFKNLYKI